MMIAKGFEGWAARDGWRTKRGRKLVSLRPDAGGEDARALTPAAPPAPASRPMAASCRPREKTRSSPRVILPVIVNARARPAEQAEHWTARKLRGCPHRPGGYRNQEPAVRVRGPGRTHCLRLRTRPRWGGWKGRGIPHARLVRQRRSERPARS